MAVYLNNRISNPSSASPFELLRGSQPRRDRLRVFGCQAWAHDQSQDAQKKKLLPRSNPMVFLGYEGDGHLINPLTGRTVTRRDIIFDEGTFPFPNTEAITEVKEAPPEIGGLNNYDSEPKSLTDWKAAKDYEMTMIRDMDVWDIVDRPRRKILTGKWAYKEKDDGTKRARFVVCVFLQNDLSQYQPYAATLLGQTTRMLFAWAVHRHQAVRQTDVKSAFLHPQINRDVFVELPPGYKQPGKVAKLKRGLYGLRTSPQARSEHLTSTDETISVFVDDLLFDIYRRKRTLC